VRTPAVAGGVVRMLSGLTLQTPRRVARGLDVASLDFKALHLVVTDGAAIDRFRDVTFVEADPGVDRLTLLRAAGTHTFERLSFTTAPDPGFAYVSLFDADGTTATPFSVTIAQATPADPGTFTKTDGVAQLVWGGGLTAVWTGAVSADWFTPGNWSSGAVPGDTTDVTIPAAAALQPEVRSGLATAGDLTVHPGATVFIDAGAMLDVAGNATVSAQAGQGTLRMSGTGTVQGSLQRLAVVGTTTVGGPFTVALSLDLNGALDLGSASLSIPTVTQADGSTLTGSGALTVTGLFGWSGGTQHGSGTTTVAPDATLDITGSAGKTIDGRLVVSEGTAIWGGSGAITIGNAGALRNEAGATMTVTAAPSGTYIAVQGAGAPGSVENLGTLIKSDVILTRLDVPFHNPGTLDIQGGSWSLQEGGTSSGDILIGPAGTLDFSGIFGDTAAFVVTGGVTGQRVTTFGGKAAFSGTFDVHSLLMNTGTTKLSFLQPPEAPALVDSLELDTSAQLGGSGVLVVRDTADWRIGALVDAGTTRVAPGAVLTISGTVGSRQLFDRTLVNEGTVRYTGSGSLFVSNGTIDNRPGATFDARSQAVMAGSGYSANAGAFTKSAGGILAAEITFDNDGTVDVTSGSLILRGGGTSPGPFALTGENLGLQFLGRHTLSGAITGTDINDVVTIAGNDTVIVAGPYDVWATVVQFDEQFGGGVLEFSAGADTSRTRWFNHSSGVVGGSGTLRVSNGGTWSGGQWTGKGATVFDGPPRYEIVHIAESGDMRIEERTVEIRGAGLTLTLDQTCCFRIGDSAVVRNLGGTFDALSGGIVEGFNGGRFDHAFGTFRVAAGSDTLFSAGLPQRHGRRPDSGRAAGREWRVRAWRQVHVGARERDPG
jgi:hypothetical protein